MWSLKGSGTPVLYTACTMAKASTVNLNITCHILKSHCEIIPTLDPYDSFSTSLTYLLNDTAFHKHWIQTLMYSIARDFTQEKVNHTRTHNITEHSNLDTHEHEGLKSQLTYWTLLIHSSYKMQ